MWHFRLFSMKRKRGKKKNKHLGHQEDDDKIELNLQVKCHQNSDGIVRRQAPLMFASLQPLCRHLT